MVTAEKQRSIIPLKNVVLPTSPDVESCPLEMAVYSRFMRYLRHVPNSRMEIKILSSLQFTADMLDHSDAHISKTLTELGLRASRMAFPVAFLSYVDACLRRKGQVVGAPSAAILDLARYWEKTESRDTRILDFQNLENIHETVQWCA